MHVPAFDRTPQRGGRRQQPPLPDHLVERARPHAFCERAHAGIAFAEQVGRWAIREFLSTSPLSVAQVLGVLGRHHSTPWLERIDVPTAVVVTTRDELIPAGRQRDMAALIPGASVHETAVGHGGCVLEAATFVPVMLEAIASVQSRLEAQGSQQCG